MASFKHHGIKGQQWGVRNGPPYPIEDKVLKKGTRLNSVSGKYQNPDKYRKNGRAIYTYRKDEEWDKKIYEGPFSWYIATKRGAEYITKHEFETTQDLRMPTSGERKKAFDDLLENKKTNKIFKKDLERCQKILVYYNVGNEQQKKDYRNFDVNNIKTAKDKLIAYDIFNHAMEHVYAYESTKLYMKKMQENYEAMVDDNNVNVYNEAHDPIIIFRGDKYLKSIPEETRYLTVQEVIDNYNEVKEELAKKGKNVSL